jgi:alpha-glucoside transport system permease protein
MTTADLLGKIIQVVAALAVFSLVIGLILFLIDKAPKRGRDYWQLSLFLAPTLILLVLGLIYPAIRTTLLSFTNSSGEWAGLDNFIWMFTQPAALITLGNTIIWVIVAPLLSTAIGLAYAVFID